MSMGRGQCETLAAAIDRGWRQLSARAFAPTPPRLMIQLLTFDMVPVQHRWTAANELAFLQHAANRYGVPVGDLRLHFAVELPDHPLSWAYQAAYARAAQEGTALVPPAVTALDLWQDRLELMLQSLDLLRDGLPPTVAFLSVAVIRRSE